MKYQIEIPQTFDKELADEIKLAFGFVVDFVEKSALSSSDKDKILKYLSEIEFMPHGLDASIYAFFQKENFEAKNGETTNGKTVYISEQPFPNRAKVIAHELLHACSCVFSQDIGFREKNIFELTDDKKNKITNPNFHNWAYRYNSVCEASTCYFANKFDASPSNEYAFITRLFEVLVDGIDESRLSKAYILGNRQLLEELISEKYGFEGTGEVEKLIKSMEFFTLMDKSRYVCQKKECTTQIMTEVASLYAKLLVNKISKEVGNQGAATPQDVLESILANLDYDKHLTDFAQHFISKKHESESILKNNDVLDDYMSDKQAGKQKLLEQIQKDFEQKGILAEEGESLATRQGEKKQYNALDETRIFETSLTALVQASVSGGSQAITQKTNKEQTF